MNSQLPSRSEPFWMGRISSDGIVLELGKKRTPTKFMTDENLRMFGFLLINN